MTTNIKTVLNHPTKGQDIRRFQLGSLEKPFDELIGFLTEIYVLPPEKLALRYRDDDGDDCSIGSNIELLEAFRIAKQDGRSVLKVDVSIDEEPTRKEESMTPGKSEPVLGRSHSESSNDEDFVKVEIESESKSVSPNMLVETSNDTKIENNLEVSNPIKIVDIETSPAPATDDIKREINSEVPTPIKVEDSINISIESPPKVEIPKEVSSEVPSIEAQSPSSEELEIKVLPSVTVTSPIESSNEFEPAPTQLESKKEFPEPIPTPVESKTELPEVSEEKELPPFPSRTEFFSLLTDFLHDSKVMILVQLLLPQVLKLLDEDRPPVAEVLKNVDTVIKTSFDFAPVLKMVPLFARLLPFTNQLAADPEIQPLVKNALLKLHDASKLTSFFRSGPNGSIPHMPDFDRLYDRMSKVVSKNEEKEVLEKEVLETKEVQVIEKKEAQVIEKKEVLPEPAPIAVHRGITCDECQMSPIQGNRYKCYACPNYDLCEMCEEAGKHPIDHPMLKIRMPINKQCRGARKPGHPRAHFVEDITLRDGSACYPGISVEKTWALKNNGEFRWPQGVKLLFLSGDLAPESVKEVPLAEPGATVQVSALIKLPLYPKQYTGYYRLATEDGKNFGPRFWADIVVVPQVTPCDKKIEVEQPKMISPQTDIKKQQPINVDAHKQERITVEVYNIPKPDIKKEEPKVDKKPETVPKVDIKKEEPKVEVKKPEEPKVEVKKPEEPKVEVKKPEQPKLEVPKVDVKKPEQPKPDVKKTEPTKPQVKSPYATQLEILRSMGFEDVELNSYLLANNEGNVQRVVEWMLSHGTH